MRQPSDWEQREPTTEAAGREAERPSQLPRPAWRDIIKRVKEQNSKDNLSMISSGVAFYAFLAIFPALAAMVSLWGLVANPADVENMVNAVSGMLPQEAAQLIQQQLQGIVQTSGSALGFGAIAGLLVTLWSATKGTKGLMTALNIAYEEEEKRGFIKFNATALLLTLGVIVAVIVTLFLMVAVPPLVGALGLPEPVQTLINLLRWPLLAVAFAVGLSVFYRYAPSRDKPRWRWVSYGSVVATVLWLIISGLFAWYVNNFGNYDATYGALGAVVILMLWLSLSAYVILIGAEFNSEMERQTARDTTVGQPQPMGRRGARVADETVVSLREKGRRKRK